MRAVRGALLLMVMAGCGAAEGGRDGAQRDDTQCCGAPGASSSNPSDSGAVSSSGGTPGPGSSSGNAGSHPDTSSSGGAGSASSSGGAASSSGNPSGPRILQLSANRSSIDRFSNLVISAVVTDPDGVDDLIGGTLTNGAGLSYGAFATSAAEGAYQMTLGWTDLNEVEPITFEGGGQRTFYAEFFDQNGNRTVGQVSVELVCPEAPDACSGYCTNLDTSAAHCGACGNACTGPASQCHQGTCGCPDPDDQVCGSRCVDTSEDELNCGACGNACTGPASVCREGACACPYVNEQVCGGVCMDTFHDELNCGGCGNECTWGQECRMGTCAGRELPADGQAARWSESLNNQDLTWTPPLDGCAGLWDTTAAWRVERFDNSQGTSRRFRACLAGAPQAHVAFFAQGFDPQQPLAGCILTLASSATPDCDPQTGEVITVPAQSSVTVVMFADVSGGSVLGSMRLHMLPTLPDDGGSSSSSSSSSGGSSSSSSSSSSGGSSSSSSSRAAAVEAAAAAAAAAVEAAAAAAAVAAAVVRAARNPVCWPLPDSP